MTINDSGLPMRLAALFCALFLLIIPALPLALPVESGPATEAQDAFGIDAALTAQPLIIAPAPMEGEEDADTPGGRSAFAVLSQTCLTVFPAAAPAYKRAIAFRARAPPLSA